MAVQFTERQRQAIEARGQNLLVGAAAGSGKTAVLVERIVQLLLEGASLENLLVVTFSRAAAAEMRERVADRLAAEPGAHARAQIELLPRAQIKTLHSFCIWLLREHFLEADLPPTFSVGAGAAQAAIERRALAEALDAALEGEDAPTLARLGTVQALEESLAPALCRMLLCQRDRAAWAADALEKYKAACEDFDGSALGQVARSCREEILREAEGKLRRALALTRLPGGPSAYAATLEGDLAALLALEPRFDRLKPVSKKEEVDPGLQEAVKALRGDAKDLCVKKLPLFVPPEEEEAARAAEMLPSLEALLRLCEGYLQRAEAYRLEAGRLDYTDLERYALRVLAKPHVREAVRAQFDYVLVDEYQDTNAVQEAILQAATRGDNLFMVGDVKQSIYRFRMTDPGIFLAKQREYDRGGNGRRIVLNSNFRSVPGVLDAVNHIFARAMVGGAAEIIYDDNEALYPGRDVPEAAEPAVEVVLIDEPSATAEEIPEEGEITEEELTSVQAEALEAARRIREMIDTGFPVPEKAGGTRPARPGDFAILLRAVAGRAPVFQRALEERGIAATVDAGGALFAAPEVAAFLDLLRAVDNRRRDLPLLGAMRSFGGFSLEALARIRLSGGRKGSFARAAFAVAEGEGDLAVKVKGFLAWLLELRALSRGMALPEFLAETLARTRYVWRQALHRRGEARAHNLRAFCSMAGQMEGGSLGDFLDAVAAAQKAHGDGDTAKVVADDQDAVRIMSVHKSKGLEFPVVIGARLGARLNTRDAGGNLLAGNRLGIACKWTDERVVRRRETFARAILAEAIKREGLAEEARILYVLTTRARERLILLGSCDVARRAAKWAGMGPGLSGAGSLLDIAGAALIRHPDMRGLRDRQPSEVEIEPHPARYALRVIEKPTAENVAAREGDLLVALEALLAERAPLPEATLRRLRFRPARPDGALLQKTSVTLRGGSRREVALPPALPLFLQERRGETAAQRGTATHAALRALDFSALRGLRGEALLRAVEESLAEMAARRLLAPGQDIRAEAIAAFFEHPLGQAALLSPRVLREQPFNLRVGEGEAVQLMQGVIDLCFLDAEGQWVVVDYKTDRWELAPEAVRERHGAQIRAYAEALEQLTGVAVSRGSVFLFETGEEVTGAF